MEAPPKIDPGGAEPQRHPDAWFHEDTPHLVPEAGTQVREDPVPAKRAKTAKPPPEMALGIIFDSPEYALAPWQRRYMKDLQDCRLAHLQAGGADLTLKTISQHGLIDHPSFHSAPEDPVEQQTEFDWSWMEGSPKPHVRKLYREKGQSGWWAASAQVAQTLLSTGQDGLDDIGHALMKDLGGNLIAIPVLYMAVTILESERPERLLDHAGEWKGFRAKDILSALKESVEEAKRLLPGDGEVEDTDVLISIIESVLKDRKWKAVLLQLRAVMKLVHRALIAPQFALFFFDKERGSLDALWTSLSTRFGDLGISWTFAHLSSPGSAEGPFIIEDPEIELYEGW